MEGTIQIKPKNPDSRWVALDANNKIIAEGKEPNIVKKAAEKLGRIFFLMYVPEKGVTYFL